MMLQGAPGGGVAVARAAEGICYRKGAVARGGKGDMLLGGGGCPGRQRGGRLTGAASTLLGDKKFLLEYRKIIWEMRVFLPL